MALEETSKSAVLDKEKKERDNLEQVKRQQHERTLNKKKVAAARQEDIDHCVDRALRAHETAMMDRMQKLQEKESKVASVTEVRSQMSATAAAKTRAVAITREQVKDSVSATSGQPSLKILRKHKQLLSALDIDFSELQTTADALTLSMSSPKLRRPQSSGSLTMTGRGLATTPVMLSADRPVDATADGLPPRDFDFGHSTSTPPLSAPPSSFGVGLNRHESEDGLGADVSSIYASAEEASIMLQEDSDLGVQL